MKKTKELKKLLAVVFAGAIAVTAFAGCGESGSSSDSSSKDSSTSGELMSNEEIIKKAAADGKVGNWGLGNEYEILALLQIGFIGFTEVLCNFFKIDVLFT